MRKVTCPVCKNFMAQEFFNPGPQPLATLGWPETSENAKNMDRFAMDYVQCPECTHVWNASFSYDSIPYQTNPSRMFNQGYIWQGFLQEVRHKLVSKLEKNPVITEIGCGEGHFLRGISDALAGQGRFLGFDPDVSGESGLGIEFQARLFDPFLDVIEYEPDLIIMRHVLEHLVEPKEFISSLSWAANSIKKETILYVEVPCIDRVLETDRLSDFFYEHPSHFTSRSFNRLLSPHTSHAKVSFGYGREVIYSVLSLGPSVEASEQAVWTKNFFKRTKSSIATVKSQLKAVIASGKKIAVWGGTGKAAAFINHYQLELADFPLVVDSDKTKVGTFVAGTGQLIEYRDVLLSQKVDVVIIPSQWRARDICAEMAQENIRVPEILIEHQGRLINFNSDIHPY